MKESELQDRIRIALGCVPGLVLWRNNVGVSRTASGGFLRYGVGGNGAADLIGIYKGRLVAVEVKTEKGVQSNVQKQWQGVVERNGGIYVVIRSVGEATEWAMKLSTGENTKV
jgi:hypothetical protein